MADVLERDMAEAPAAAEVMWREKRTRPIVAFYGVPTVFLAITAVVASSWVLDVLLAVGAVTFGLLGLRARRTALMETYTVTDREARVERPHQPAQWVPLAEVERATFLGDKVFFDTGVGRALTMDFVRHQRSLMRTLERVAPTVVVERKLDAFCRT
jgi:hypothetical protein